MGEEPRKQGLSHTWNSLTIEKQISVGILGVIAIVVLVLGYVQMRRNLISPFTAPLEDLVSTNAMVEPLPEEIAREQQRTDTDGDGLSDWHELNVFRTSPYVADTDSDGEPDNIEIAKGEDPNCPKGQACVQALSADSLATTTQRLRLPGTNVEQPIAPAGLDGVIPARDPEAIRAFLRARGSSEAELNQFSDEEILQAYDRAAAGQSLQEPPGSEGATDLSDDPEQPETIDTQP
ncbi:hypothetical protein GF380_03560 [Candidatus Uhrbacteria bacterium]|nr:hypothetical protein [Candidatus Uhrbacteria bacterium]